MKYLIYFLMLIFCISSCETKPGSDSQWISIFDGVSTDGWRGYNSNEMPPGWTVKDGMLMFDTELELEQNYKGGRDIIYGNQENTIQTLKMLPRIYKSRNISNNISITMIYPSNGRGEPDM